MPILTCPVPSTVSFLTTNTFQFEIQKYPEVTYFVQEVQIPSLTLPNAMHTNPLSDVKVPGDKLAYEDLQIQFLVDETMTNYLSVYNWMIGLGFPEDHSQFTNLMNDARNGNGTSESVQSVSDCTLNILNSDNLHIRKFTFIDAFPVGLSALTFNSTNSDLTYMVGSLTLAYSYYTMT